MLYEENKTLKFTNNCIKDCHFVFIVRPCDQGNGNIRVVMIEISEEEENQLNSDKSLSLNRGGLSFNIHPDCCLAYGEFNLSPNSEDVDKFSRAGWLTRYTVRQFIPSEYDYENHCVVSDIRRGRWFDTDNIKTYLPYLYACINKPKRICIFKEYIDIVAIRKANQKIEREKMYYHRNKEYLKQKRQKRVEAKRKLKLSNLKINVK